MGSHTPLQVKNDKSPKTTSNFCPKNTDYADKISDQTVYFNILSTVRGFENHSKTGGGV